MSTNYENVKNWIINSGLVITNHNDANYGAVHSFFDENTEKYGFLYPEITGYSVSTFCFLHETEKDDFYIKLGKASSDWIIAIFQKYGGVIHGIEDKDNSREQLAYSFDTGICAKGLLDCYKLTNEEKYLENAKKLVNWLKQAITEQGTLSPYMELESNEFKESNQVWYKKWGCLHIKTCIPFLTLYQITKEKNYLDIALKICNNYSQFQNSDGSFSIHKNVQTINLHTMSYALEGLLYAFIVTKNEKYFQSIENALEWISNRIEEDGSIKLWFNSKYNSKAVYPIAQIIRIMLLSDKYQNKNKFLNNIIELRSFMVSMQASKNNPKINGGFYEEYYKKLFGWKLKKKLNSWGSLFALQALYWFDNYEKINFDKAIWSLY